MKKQLFLSALLLLCSAALFAQKKVSILGDSYSTYKGFITPDTNEPWYPFEREKNGKRENDVTDVSQTWWRLFIEQNKDRYALEVNNSYSGATISCHGYRNEDYCYRSYATRCVNLGNPDIILIFGATNDSWAGAQVGEYKYANWTKQDLFFFRPALAHLLTTVRMYYPKAELYFILNTDLREEIDESIYKLCPQYGVQVITLQNIDKQAGHPSQKGMKAIAKQVAAFVNGAK